MPCALSPLRPQRQHRNRPQRRNPSHRQSRLRPRPRPRLRLHHQPARQGPHRQEGEQGQGQRHHQHQQLRRQLRQRRRKRRSRPAQGRMRASKECFSGACRERPLRPPAACLNHACMFQASHSLKSAGSARLTATFAELKAWARAAAWVLTACTAWGRRGTANRWVGLPTCLAAHAAQPMAECSMSLQGCLQARLTFTKQAGAGAVLAEACTPMCSGGRTERWVGVLPA